MWAASAFAPRNAPSCRTRPLGKSTHFCSLAALYQGFLALAPAFLLSGRPAFRTFGLSFFSFPDLAKCGSFSSNRLNGIDPGGSVKCSILG